MTVLIDDLLVRPFVGLLETLHEVAVTELYDEEAIQNELKENRLLYEMGDRSEAEYTRRKEELEAQLDAAREAKEELGGRARVIR